MNDEHCWKLMQNYIFRAHFELKRNIILPTVMEDSANCFQNCIHEFYLGDL